MWRQYVQKAPLKANKVLHKLMIQSSLCAHGHDRTVGNKASVKPSWKTVPFLHLLLFLLFDLYCTYISAVAEIKWDPPARSCELINVLRSAYSIPLYILARLQLWQSIQSAVLMNPLQSSWEQAGAASFDWPQSNYHSAKPKRTDGWMDGLIKHIPNDSRYCEYA